MNAKSLVVIAMTGAAAISVVAVGCQKTLNSTAVTMANHDGEPKAAATTRDAAKDAGALLWSQNCMRCHNYRRPRERSDREWDVIVHHMRVRGNLTAKEHRLILRFLQSAN